MYVNYSTDLRLLLGDPVPRLVDCPRGALGWTAAERNYRAHCLQAKKCQLSSKTFYRQRSYVNLYCHWLNQSGVYCNHFLLWLMIFVLVFSPPAFTSCLLILNLYRHINCIFSHNFFSVRLSDLLFVCLFNFVVCFLVNCSICRCL